MVIATAQFNHDNAFVLTIATLLLICAGLGLFVAYVADWFRAE